MTGAGRLVWLIPVLVIAIAAWESRTRQPRIPKVWDERALAEWATPLAGS